MDAILVSSDFQEAYNLLAIISSNPKKPSPIHYVIVKENGNLTSFAAYIMQLIACCWFKHGNLLILDNAVLPEVMLVMSKIICGTRWWMDVHLTFL
jgi:hypothetical protein